MSERDMRSAAQILRDSMLHADQAGEEMAALRVERDRLTKELAETVARARGEGRRGVNCESALRMVEVSRDAWCERAEKAEAALSRVQDLLSDREKLARVLARHEWADLPADMMSADDWLEVVDVILPAVMRAAEARA